MSVPPKKNHRNAAFMVTPTARTSSNQSTAFHRLWQDGLQRAKFYVRKVWIQCLVLGILVFILVKKDFSFHLSFGKGDGSEQTYAGSLIPLGTSETKPAKAKPTHAPKKESSEPKVEKSAPKAKTKKSSGGSKKTAKSVDDLNLANVATATSNALSAKEKATAESISNLTLVLSPNYAKRHNLSDDVVRAKLMVCLDYVKLHLPSAKQAAKDYNIPISITLAQGLLESNAGESLLARKANNHFGIKCFSRTCRKGHCMNATDDSHKDFFIIFKTDADCFEYRSAFLQKQRYASLLKLPRTAYRDWAWGLKKAGYATDNSYARKLIKIIENLRLYRFDY